jgi:hypothetical protein
METKPNDFLKYVSKFKKNDQVFTQINLWK